jgi:FMN-dependent NADH-azoreductase
VARLLYISASPKRDLSVSRRLAARFLAAYSTRHPEDEIDELDVFAADLPAYGADHAIAKFALLFREQLTEAQGAAWQEVIGQIDRFKSADKILLACPMWNYSIPWPLKQYLDCIMQPGVTFGYDPQKMIHLGLLANRPVQFILTRSSIMPGDYADFQLPYLRYAFSAMGLNDLRVVSAWQTTKPSAEARAAYVETFVPQVEAAAAAF